MAWAHVPGAAAILAGNAGGVTVIFDSSGCDFLIASFAWYFGVTPNPTLTDDTSGSNTWNGLTGIVDGAEAKVRIYWCRPVATSATHSLTLAGLSIFASGGTFGFTGSDASPFDQEAGTDGDRNQPGSITPAGADYLFVSAVGVRGGSGYTVNAGLTYQSQGYGGGTNEGLGMGWLIQSGGPTGVNPTWSVSSACTQATFVPGTGGGGGGDEQPAVKRFGGVPHMGLNQLRGGHRGGVWGQTREGLIVPRRRAA